MVINPSKENNTPQGFNPNVDNTTVFAKPTSSQKNGYLILLFLSWITIIPGIAWLIIRIKRKNEWIDLQMKINNASSSIDISLTRRSETLKKLLDQAKGYLKHERETLEKITSMRSNKTPNGIIDADKALNDLSRNIQIAIENYPDLKANSIIGELMSSSQYIESEIAASRRLYNQYVQRFNADILMFPNVCYAAKQKMSTLPLFIASETQKQDIDMSSLSDF
ncbi:LemA family protein [Mycoplasmoides pirum]|uniref:LemA family protein n=1 Tax=Mycoplasmoides pirum TaxID=2122 RepID=UPI00047F3461|nr:LemA family protein [Mycoplasmoides pirum]